jgi:hypothetical protein
MKMSQTIKLPELAHGQRWRMRNGEEVVLIACDVPNLYCEEQTGYIYIEQRYAEEPEASQNIHSDENGKYVYDSKCPHKCDLIEFLGYSEGGVN